MYLYVNVWQVKHVSAAFLGSFSLHMKGIDSSFSEIWYDVRIFNNSVNSEHCENVPNYEHLRWDEMVDSQPKIRKEST